MPRPQTCCASPRPVTSGAIELDPDRTNDKPHYHLICARGVPAERRNALRRPLHPTARRQPDGPARTSPAARAQGCPRFPRSPHGDRRRTAWLRRPAGLIEARGEHSACTGTHAWLLQYWHTPTHWTPEHLGAIYNSVGPVGGRRRPIVEAIAAWQYSSTGAGSRGHTDETLWPQQRPTVRRPQPRHPTARTVIMSRRSGGPVPPPCESRFVGEGRHCFAV